MKTLPQKISTEILTENDQVLKFIKNWQLKNDYNPMSLKPYNEKFKIEFNYYLKNNNFSKDTITIFEV